MTDIDTLWTGTGLELDAVGARPEIGLLRDGAESDEVYRGRIVAALRNRLMGSMVFFDPREALLSRIRELGVTEVSEEIIAPYHFRLTVDGEYVNVVKQAIYDIMPIVYRVDVIPRDSSAPQAPV